MIPFASDLFLYIQQAMAIDNNATPANRLTIIPTGSVMETSNNNETIEAGIVSKERPVIPSKIAIIVSNVFIEIRQITFILRAVNSPDL